MLRSQLVQMAITLTSDFIYVLAMLKTTPLVVTIGLSLTMPLAVVGDFILKKPTKLQVIIGATIVLMSFVAVGLEDSNNREKEDLISGRRLDEEGDTAVRLSEDVHLDSRGGRIRDLSMGCRVSKGLILNIDCMY